MKTPADTVKGQIVGYDPKTGEVTIKAAYTDWPTMAKREYRECLVQMVDSRPLSEKQRRSCYAMIREIADYTGMEVEEAKTWMKLKYLSEDFEGMADRIFSLANASMSLVCEFQAFLVDFILAWGIPTRKPLITMVDDVEQYIYSCLIHRKCCVCGKPAHLHHVDRVGAGNDRKAINHIGLRAEPLCFEHHTECHTKPQDEFDGYYHIKPVRIDKTIAKVYGLNVKNKGGKNDAE